MNGFRQWFSNFMIGRYGGDQLNRFLCWVTIGLIIINLFLNWRILHLIILALIIWSFARIFSRSIYNRQRENMKYMQLKAKFTGKAKGSGKGTGNYTYADADGRVHRGSDGANSGKRILICPFCGEKLRVPVGAGKIKVRCPHCNQEFEETV